MRPYSLSIALILAAGCDQNSESTTLPDEHESSPASTSVTPAASVPFVPVNTPEDLQAAFKDAYARGDTAAIEQMVFWGDLKQDDKDLTLVYRLMTRIAGKGTITHAEVREPKEGEYKPGDFTLEPKLTLEFNFDGDGVGGDSRIPIGEVDGKCYFGALIRK